MQGLLLCRDLAVLCGVRKIVVPPVSAAGAVRCGHVVAPSDIGVYAFLGVCISGCEFQSVHRAQGTTTHVFKIIYEPLSSLHQLLYHFPGRSWSVGKATFLFRHPGLQLPTVASCLPRLLQSERPAHLQKNHDLELEQLRASTTSSSKVPSSTFQGATYVENNYTPIHLQHLTVTTNVTSFTRPHTTKPTITETITMKRSTVFASIAMVG